MKKQLLILLFLATSINLFAQIKNIPDSALFDFWVGDWDLTWNANDSTKGKGTNKIIKILDKKVIQENFIDASGFKGTSISVYNVRRKVWNQSWADNAGGYFSFIGETEGEKRIFKTEPRIINNDTMVLRMVFYDVKQDSFIWDWEMSKNGGRTWELNWRIYYTRKKKLK
jgi:hypothetical protein